MTNMNMDVAYEPIYIIETLVSLRPASKAPLCGSKQQYA